MQPLYTAQATAKAGRDGHVKTDDGTLDLKLAVPKGLGGPGGAGTNPEQLFASGYAACFGSALKLVAGQKGLSVGDVAVRATVHIFKKGAGFGLAVELEGQFSKLKGPEAQSLMEAAHQVCPYSQSTRNNIEVKLSAA